MCILVYCTHSAPIQLGEPTLFPICHRLTSARCVRATYTQRHCRHQHCYPLWFDSNRHSILFFFFFFLVSRRTSKLSLARILQAIGVRCPLQANNTAPYTSQPSVMQQARNAHTERNIQPRSDLPALQIVSLCV